MRISIINAAITAVVTTLDLNLVPQISLTHVYYELNPMYPSYVELK